MSRLIALVVSMVFVVSAAVALAQGGAEKTFKTGDSVYACGCGPACPCGTLSTKAGKCGCGKPLVKTSLTKVEDGKAHYLVDGKEVVAPTAGKYVCACGTGCPCGTVSQKPGNCGCGKPMKKVE
jgi:hypothetical protein